MSDNSSLEKQNALVDVNSANHSSEAANEKVASEKEIDAGAKYLLDHPEHADYTPKEARKVLWKIDLITTSVMLVLITLAAADKIIISNAQVYGMGTSLGLVGNQYSWLGSIFYFGYLSFELPANYLLQKLPVAKTLMTSFLLWNIVLMCMGATKNFHQMAALRFLLGIGETFLFPACSVITAMFYKKKEQPFRTAIWFSGFSSVITGVLSYAIGHAHTKVENWRLLFVIFGAITIFFTIIGFIFLPDSPMTCWWLTERERYIAVHRTIENRTGIRNTNFKKYQIIEALTDWKTWVMVIFSFANNISNGGLVTFSAQIVSNLGKGHSPLTTTLLGIPTGLFMTLSSWIIASVSFFYPTKFRTISAACVCLVPITCCSIIMKVNSDNLLPAYYFFYFYWGPYVAMTSMNYANTAGNTKKSIVNGLNFTSYCVSNIVAPQLFIASEAPGYRTGYRSILAFSATSCTCVIIYGIGNFLENKRRDREFGPAEENIDPELDAMDLTDKEKERWFRYTW